MGDDTSIRITVRGSVAFRRSLERKFFLSAAVVSRRAHAWTFDVDAGSVDEFRRLLRKKKDPDHA